MATISAPTSNRLISLLPLGVAIAVVLGMHARFMADTVDYAEAAISFNGESWEFGHLAWVPLGWLAKTYGGLDTTGLIRAMLAFNAIACVIGVELMRRTLNAFVGIRTASVAAIVFLFSQAVLNFSLTGCSYIPGLTLTILALYLALSRPPSLPKAHGFAIASGAAMAAAICFWFPYFLVVPAVLLAPVLLRGAGFDFVWRAAVALGCVLLVAYGVTGYLAGLRDLAGWYGWMAGTAGGTDMSGLPRMVFGLVRSFVFMENDGLLFKRYLLGDPYNVVSLSDLIGLSLWKLALFYLLVAAVAIQLLRSADSRRLSLVIAIAALPVVAFGAFWQGGDMERYLPLYPFFFIGVASAYEARPTFRALRGFIVVCSAIVIGINGWAHSAWQVGRYEDRLTDRIRDLRPQLKPASVLIVVSDRLLLLPRDFPLNEELEGLKVEAAVVPGVATPDPWETEFAGYVLRTWQKGGDIWISTRCFAATPHPDSTWAEGDDPQLKWVDVVAFFRTLATEETDVDDGFVRLRDTATQRDRLAAWASTVSTHTGP